MVLVVTMPMMANIPIRIANPRKVQNTGSPSMSISRTRVTTALPLIPLTMGPNVVAFPLTMGPNVVAFPLTMGPNVVAFPLTMGWNVVAFPFTGP